MARRQHRAEEAAIKFLVLWQLEQSLLSTPMAEAIGRMPGYGAGLEAEGKVLARYHVVGAHGGAWIYDVETHEEFEMLLARAPVFNFARYTIHPLADMDLGAPMTGGVAAGSTAGARTEVGD